MGEDQKDDDPQNPHENRASRKKREKRTQDLAEEVEGRGTGPTLQTPKAPTKAFLYDFSGK